MKYKGASRNFSIFKLFLIVIFIAVSVTPASYFALKKSTDSSLEKKRSLLIEQISELNNTLQSANLTDGYKPSVHHNLEQFHKSVEKLEYPHINFIESALGRNSVYSLEKVSLETKDAISITSKEVSGLQDQLEALSKLIQYDAVADFKDFGADSATDLQRMERMKLALGDLLSDSTLEQSYKERIKALIAAIDALGKNQNLDKFTKEVSLNQTAILKSLAEKQSAITEKFNNFYLDLIYQ